MLTDERLAALHAVGAGTVTGKHLNAPGSPLVFEPRDMQIALGFLQKARLIQTETASAANRARPVTVTVTPRGQHVLRRIQP